MGKTTDPVKKTEDIKGTFHARMDTIKDRNVKVKEIKKRWQEYTDELYQKWVLMIQIIMTVWSLT